MTFTTSFTTAMRSAIQAGHTPCFATRDKLNRPAIVTLDRKGRRVFHPRADAFRVAAEHNLELAFKQGFIWKP